MGGSSKIVLWPPNSQQNGNPQQQNRTCELRKKKNSYFPLYLLVNRDPYNGLWNNPPKKKTEKQENNSGFFWLVVSKVSTHLKNIGQIGSFPQVRVKINMFPQKPSPSFVIAYVCFLYQGSKARNTTSTTTTGAQEEQPANDQPRGAKHRGWR